MKTAFKPLETKESKILILGAMPDRRTLAMQQYYGQAGNQFWKIMFILFNKPFTSNYSRRVELLQQNNIALWDVLSHCEIKNTEDGNIIKEVPNSFKSFYKTHPNIKTVIFTSVMAEKFYYKYVGKSAKRDYLLFPSPSGSNTWQNFHQKLKHWKTILDYL